MFYNISPLCPQKRDRPRKGTVSANKTNKRSAILANAPVRLRPTAPGEHRLTADILIAVILSIIHWLVTNPYLTVGYIGSTDTEHLVSFGITANSFWSKFTIIFFIIKIIRIIITPVFTVIRSIPLSGSRISRIRLVGLAGGMVEFRIRPWSLIVGLRGTGIIRMLASPSNMIFICLSPI